MALTRTRITGKVLLPTGSPATGGKLHARLSVQGSTEDTGVGTQRVGGETTFEIGSDGSVDFYLVPNDAITPSGSIYAVDYELIGGSRWQEFWNLPTSPATTEIGDIPRVNP